MSRERRYSEDEVRKIFEAAAAARDAPEESAEPSRGLTLSELQAIGRDVGLAPERVADAARALDQPQVAARSRTALGMPVTAGHLVALPRAPTDREWARLVAELRLTFEAQGREHSSGELRTWSNGNLRIHVEPAARGTQLRMVTRKGDAPVVNVVGIANVVLSALLLVVGVTGGDPEALILGASSGAFGAGALGYNGLRLSAWAQERRAQMEQVAARAVELTAGAPDRGE